MDIIIISVLAVVAGADGWSDIVQFAEDRQDWFKTFLELPAGIPCDDTFRRVFAALDPEKFQASFLSWAKYKDPAETTAREVITPRTSTVQADRDVSEAAELMARDQVRRLLVLDGDQTPVGTLSLGDIGRSEYAANAGAEALQGVTDAHGDSRSQQA